MKRGFSEMKYGWLIVSILFALASNVSRSMRWQMLLEPLGKRPPFLNTFLILLIAYFANLGFPRLGEAARVGLMQKYEGISFDKVLGTVIIDRLIDVITLALIFLIVFILQRDVLGTIAQENIIGPMNAKLSALLGSSGLILGVGAILACIAVFLFVKFAGSIGTKLGGLLKRVMEGMTSVLRLKNLPLFIFHSFFIWTMYFCMIYVCFFSSELTRELPTVSALSILAFGALSVALTPGGIGAYPVAVQQILLQYGIDLHLGLGFGWVVWGLQTLTIIIAGFFALLFFFGRNKPLIESGKN